MKDALFTEETTEEDLMLAQAHARRALARGHRRGAGAALSRAAAVAGRHSRSRPGRRPVRDDDRGREKRARATARARRRSRGRTAAETGQIIAASSGMAEGSVWFRAAIGRKKNAEARWLLPMICRRGGIDKQDIGAIRIMDTTTEFEISGDAAESFAAMIKRPDKEDNIRIEAMAEAPQAQAPQEKRVLSATPRSRRSGARRSPERSFPRRARAEAARQASGRKRAGLCQGAGLRQEKEICAQARLRRKPPEDRSAAGKPAFGKKKKKKFAPDPVDDRLLVIDELAGRTDRPMIESRLMSKMMIDRRSLLALIGGVLTPIDASRLHLFPAHQDHRAVRARRLGRHHRASDRQADRGARPGNRL